MPKILAVLLSLGLLGVVVSLARHNGSNAQYSLKVYAGEGVAGSLPSNSDVIHGCDDFVSNNIGSSRNWKYVGSSPLSFLPWQPGHQGIISIPTGTTTSINELIGKQVCASPSPSFSGINKCVARFVASCDALFTGSGGFDGEWFVGIGNPDGTGNVYAGAMLSFAPGFPDHPSAELLAGSYTNQFNHTETRMCSIAVMDTMKAWAISPRVNSPRNNDPGILDPVRREYL